jgi:hypothetical protein
VLDKFIYFFHLLSIAILKNKNGTMLNNETSVLESFFHIFGMGVNIFQKNW